MQYETLIKRAKNARYEWHPDVLAEFRRRLEADAKQNGNQTDQTDQTNRMEKTA